MTKRTTISFAFLPILLFAMAGSGCGSKGAPNGSMIGSTPVSAPGSAASVSSESGTLLLPALQQAALGPGEKLEVVATTGIVGEAVARVGGEHISLHVLMALGQDPHSYEPSARDLTTVSDADAIYVNGWDLEMGLLDDLDVVSGGLPLIPVSAYVEPLAYKEGIDPHVWMNPENVMQWTTNIEQTLSRMDPRNADAFRDNAAAYRSELTALLDDIERQISQIPEADRLLVTNHDSLGYFAARFGFQIIGTLIPTNSTLAEPSASGLSRLVEQMNSAGVCTIFSETTVNDQLARAAADELTGCETVRILSLYTGSLGVAGSGADSYAGMMRLNVEIVVEGLGG